jgi:S-methylmethionine-dependent homocysteine/selenocysteine methylase
MTLEEALNQNNYVLMEAAVNEVLRRSNESLLHPRLGNALLIYEESGKKELSRLYRGYIEIAERAGTPILICTPTWRANIERIIEVEVSHDVNGDAVHFMKKIRKRYGDWSSNIILGGLIGCKNDCYKPEEGLSLEEAKTFHSWQVEKLANADVDFIMAATLPSVPEAIGIAQSISETNVPYIISFVINKEGRILDGSRISHACNAIDSLCSNPPVGFMVNCAFPSFYKPQEEDKSLIDRLIGYQANASSLDHSELDNTEILQVDDISEWGDRMIDLYRRFGVKIIGGCCGTGGQHLQYIVDHINT